MNTFPHSKFVFNGVPLPFFVIGGQETGVPTPPSPITDLTASDDLIGEILFTFTESIGYPNPVHTLVNITTGDEISSVHSPYTLTIDGGTYEFRIDAKNSSGEISSNSVQGISLEIPCTISDFTATEGEINQITVNFTVCTTGYPIPKYNLIDVNDPTNILAPDITPPYIWPVTTDNEFELRVDAYNDVGSVPSNSDTGQAIISTPAGEFIRYDLSPIDGFLTDTDNKRYVNDKGNITTKGDN